MSGPTINDPKTQTVELYDLDVVSAAGSSPASNRTPRTGFGFARAFMVNGPVSPGTIKIDLVGIPSGTSPAAGQTLTVSPYVMYYIGITKIYSSGTTATGVTVFY